MDKADKEILDFFRDPESVPAGRHYYLTELQKAVTKTVKTFAFGKLEHAITPRVIGKLHKIKDVPAIRRMCNALVQTGVLEAGAEKDEYFQAGKVPEEYRKKMVDRVACRYLEQTAN